jgi:tetratricopeptide (TPR) repeat protein
MKTKESKAKAPMVTGKIGLVVRIEMAPLDVSLWEELAGRLKIQNDLLSTKTLDVIISGLKAMAESFKKAEANHVPLPKLSTLSTGQFSRLSKSYNNPKLLKEIGVIYLNELHLPAIALQHFERSQQLGCTEKELTYLIETAAVVAQQQSAQEKGGTPAHSGVSQAQHARPIAADVIRKTDKLLISSKLRPPPSQNPSSKFEPAEKIAEADLPSTTAECLAEAGKALEQGKLNRAHALLVKANKNPASDDEMWAGWTDLGMAYYETNSYAGMEAAYEQAHQYGRNRVASCFNLALAQHLNQNFEGATAFYLTAERIEPKNPKVWCNLGVLYFQKEQYARAEAALRQAVEARPDYARAWDNLGSALGSQNMLEEAFQACQRAAELNPTYPEAHFKMGIIHFGAGRQLEAAESFRLAMQLPILRPYIYAFMGIIQARTEHPEEAEASIRQAAAADPGCGLLWTAWNELGMARSLAKEYDKAIDAYDEALSVKADEPEIWFNLGLNCHAAGYHARAQHFYQRAIDLNPHYYKAWHNLGILLAELGLHSKASMAFWSALQANPDSSRTWYDLGVSLELEGRKEESKAAFTRSETLAQMAA